MLLSVSPRLNWRRVVLNKGAARIPVLATCLGGRARKGTVQILRTHDRVSRVKHTRILGVFLVLLAGAHRVVADVCPHGLIVVLVVLGVRPVGVT